MAGHGAFYYHLPAKLLAAGAAGFGYQENRVFLTIGYRPQPDKSNDSPDA